MTPKWRRDVFTGANRNLLPAAAAAYNKALRQGTLKRQPCAACGNPKSQGHHEDYSYPLDVVWLCAMHHRWRHAYGFSINTMVDGTPSKEVAA